MHILESVQECLDSSIIERLWSLIHLEDFLGALHVVTIDGERDDHLDAIVLAEVCQRSHLLGIKRTKDKVASISSLLHQGGTDVSIDRHVPSMDISRDTLLLQLFASHQDATIILHHSLTIAIYIMQRKHHTHIHRVGFLRYSGTLRSSSFLGCSFLKRNKERSTFLQHVAFLLHLRIGVHQFRECQTILVGDTEDGIFLLDCIDVTPFGGLGEDAQ